MMTNVAKIYQFEFWPEIAPSPGKSHGTSHRRCSVKKYVLRNSTKFTVKRLCQSLLFNKIAGLRP